jgi:hypothetical protein|tara:strand:- start:851 stop:1258 length:408 start_codon:yes stop_codon:yes gene_type:complete
MSTYFNDIEGALMTRLSTLANSPAVAYPNINFEPTLGTAYLRANMIPVDTVQVSLGTSGKDETSGILQIDVVQPAGEGRSTLPDNIADHFKRGTVMTYNGVNIRVRSVSISSPIRDEAWYFIPVSINFQTYTEAR